MPLLLELDKGSRVLECGTGSGSMTLFLSQHLGESGLLHTFDVTADRQLKAARYFTEWKRSYDLRPQVEKWPANVKFGCMNFNEDTSLVSRYRNFYDAIYLDMAEIHLGMLKAYELLRPGGVLVVNCMHLSQALKSLNAIEKRGVSGRLKQEVVLEPANRLWEIRKIRSGGRENRNKLDDNNNDENKDNGDLNWTLRLEDRFGEKFKRGGLFFNYWQGFLVKFRKIDWRKFCFCFIFFWEFQIFSLFLLLKQ